MSADVGFEPEAILRVLNDHEVAYVVVGGFAVAAHGVIRVPDYRSLQPPNRVSIGDLVFSVATLDALRVMKRAAGRPKDEVDLAELETLHGPEEA